MDPKTNAPTPKAVWTGRFLSGLIASLLLLDAYGKLAELQPVIEGTARMGYPVHLVFALGVIELVCVAVYLVPRTAVIGAVLLTGYFGGAVASHVRIEDPLWTHVLSGVYAASLVWGGLVLRDHRLHGFLGFGGRRAEPSPPSTVAA